MAKIRVFLTRPFPIPDDEGDAWAEEMLAAMEAARAAHLFEADED